MLSIKQLGMEWDSGLIVIAWKGFIMWLRTNTLAQAVCFRWKFAVKCVLNFSAVRAGQK